MGKRQSAIIIPALDPEEALIGYVDSLIAAGFDRIILVDDGSDEEHGYIFNELNNRKECEIVKHAVNYGKGRGLKNALNHFLCMEDVADYYGVITADSDGQHTVKDVIRISDKLEEDFENGCVALLLGSRDFDLSHVPFKSRWGNRITRGTFHLLYGKKLKDTQTGLRGIPTSMIPSYIDLEGERFEYETNMLMATALDGGKITEVTIDTVYENDNKGTHFNAIRDSWSIYKLLFGSFIKSRIPSLIIFAFDVALFKMVLSMLKTADFSAMMIIPLATIAARVISELLRSAFNKKKKDFISRNNISNKVKYYIVWFVKMICSAAFVTLIFSKTGISEIILKIIVDGVLAFSYSCFSLKRSSKKN